MDSEKTVLILGAIEAFCDLIEDAKDLGYRTVICDYYSDAPGKKIADISYDVSTTDKDAVRELAVKHKVDGIVCSFSDRNIQVCYDIAQELGLPTFYTQHAIDTLTNKIKMKEFFAGSGFPTLRYALIKEGFKDDELAGFEFPVIIKPVDNSGSKGIRVCGSIEELRESLPGTLAFGVNEKETAIVEEYYPTNELSVTAWVRDGKVYVTNIYDVVKNYGEKILVSKVVFPSKYIKENYDDICALLQDIIDAIGIRQGPVALQCLVGERGLKVNELIYRLTGGCSYLFTEFMGGPNLAKMLLSYCAGDDIDYSDLEAFTPVDKATSYEYRIYATKPGRISFDFDEASVKEVIPECKYFHIYSPSGTVFQNIPTAGKVVARMICMPEDASVTGYEDLLGRMAEAIVIKDEEGNNITSFHEPEKEDDGVIYDLKLKDYIRRD